MFPQKSINTTVDYKNKREKYLIAKKRKDNKKDGLKISQNPARLHPLQPQNCKSIKLWFKRKAPELGVVALTCNPSTGEAEAGGSLKAAKSSLKSQRILYADFSTMLKPLRL